MLSFARYIAAVPTMLLRPGTTARLFYSACSSCAVWGLYARATGRRAQERIQSSPLHGHVVPIFRRSCEWTPVLIEH